MGDKPEDLLAAAITSWLMGDTAIEKSVATARKRLKARELSLRYLREKIRQCGDMLASYFRDTDALPFDELQKLISLLPPPDADKVIPTSEVTRTVGSVSYLLKLPPEYQHTRPYPLLIALPQAGQKPADVLKLLGDMPGKHGYIVAVVDWGRASGRPTTTPKTSNRS